MTNQPIPDKPLLLSLDQSTDCTGFAISDLSGQLLEVGALQTPNAVKYKARSWQVQYIHDLMRRVDWQYDDRLLFVALEATYLSDHANKSAVTTLQELAKLAGGIEYACDLESIKCITVPLYDFNQYLHLPLKTKRLPRKLASLRAARVLCAETLPQHAEAFSQAVRLIEDWQPNADGQVKTPEAILSHASKLLLKLVDCTVDSADSLVIGEVARGMILQEAQKMRYE